MISRRNFLGAVGKPAAAAVAAATLAPSTLARTVEKILNYPASEAGIASDEEFWSEIQQAFTVNRSLLNLNNGGVSPSPAMVQDAMKRYLDFSNEATSYTMWGVLEPQRETVRTQLARMFKCDREEIALTRNASEGLQICQLGLDLKPGDEILTTTQDYGRMITTWKQRERRDGIVMKQFQIPVPAEDPDEIVRLFEQNMTPRTKVILMCHMINLTGQVLPVKKVVQMARQKGVPVIVDGAHSFAHFDFTLEDLDCDYYATSLHKWLTAPHGTGMLYVRKNKIKDLWPMMAATEAMDDNIRKFEEIGTHPAANYLAISEAVTFNEAIGLKRKGERLAYLRDYWANRLLKHDRVIFNTSQKPGFAYGIGNVHIDGVDPSDLTSHLWEKHRIIVVAIKHPEFQGIRVTPHVYTTLPELDRFCDAMEDVVKNGIPAS